MRWCILSLIMTASAYGQAPLQKPAAPTSPVTPVAGGKAPVVVNGNGSCATCNSAASVHNPGLFRIGAGTINPVGCGCWQSEKTFLWGGCKQFWNPQLQCGAGCGHGFRGLGDKCPTIQYGPGLPTGANNCAGTFSYLMR